MTDDPGPLARAVKKRRLELGLRQGDLAVRGGPALATVGLIEKGKMRNPRPLTLGGLDRALEWVSGSAEAVLVGDEPIPLRSGGPEPVPSRDPGRPASPPDPRPVGGDPQDAQQRPLALVPEADLEEENEVLAAIRRDPYLDEDARAHFLNQYELLRELSARKKATATGEPLRYVAHGKRTTPVDPDEERRLEEMARQAAQEDVPPK